MSVYGPARPHADGGLQPERTSLAWSRTAVSFLVAAAIMLRWTSHFGVHLVGPLVASVVVALGIIASQRSRYRRQTQGIIDSTTAGSARAASVGVVLLTAAVTSALALGALAVVFLT